MSLENHQWKGECEHTLQGKKNHHFIKYKIKRYQPKTTVCLPPVGTQAMELPDIECYKLTRVQSATGQIYRLKIQQILQKNV